MRNENIKSVIKIFIFFSIVFIVSGCSISKEVTEVKASVIHPAAIEDTVYVKEKADTIIVGINIIKTDTVTTIKYFPKLQKFYVKVKPDSIIIWDTIKTYQTIEKIEKTPFFAKAGLVFIGLIIGAASLLLLKK